MPEILYNYRSKEDLLFENNSHYYLEIPVLQNLNDYSNKRILFLLDTGAYITVISGDTASLFGFEKLPSIVDSFSLYGFTGSCLATIKEIPGLVIGNRMLKGVKVAIPHVETKYNILGMNVLEHFKFLVDTESNCIYFSDNPHYKMPLVLRSSELHSFGINTHK